MKDKAFIDTNIFVYAFLDSENSAGHAKHLKAVDFLKPFHSGTEVIISTQVVSEYYSALLKNKIDDDEIQQSAQQLASAIDVVSLSKRTVFDSFAIRNRFHYSYWDSLIIASALEHNCTILYSEDMQHEQSIEEQLRIINPFK
ncbi:MAG: PIN domain-containing protein [Methylococcaceae bacterium]